MSSTCQYPIGPVIPALWPFGSTVAKTFKGRARVAFRFTFARGKIVAIDWFADSEYSGQLDLVILND